MVKMCWCCEKNKCECKIEKNICFTHGKIFCLVNMRVEPLNNETCSHIPPELENSLKVNEK